jgi:lipopolysaccharide/colanic/teichoic acid biosynthesis glycosyltransferase/acetyltransferase-like isoleucine patch superfamily enzyme
MELIVIHERRGDSGNNEGLLRFVLSSEPVASVTLAGLGSSCRFGRRKTVCIAIPAQWGVKSRKVRPRIINYEQNEVTCCRNQNGYVNNDWFVISHGRFVTSAHWQWLYEVLNSVAADVVTVNMSASLAAYREKVRITPDNNVVGFRRWYLDSAQPAEIPSDWPHHVFIRTNVLTNLLDDGALTLAFEKFISRCRANSFRLTGLEVAGIVLDLETEAGLLSFLGSTLNSKKVRSSNGHTIADSARIFGKIATGKNVYIGENTVISGPVILADNVKIGDGAVVKSSVIGPGVSVRQNQFLQNRILTTEKEYEKQSAQLAECKRMRLPLGSIDSFGVQNGKKAFRKWPGISYPVFFKRICDFIGALIVLAFFMPVFPIIAVVIKLTSPGPVFYRARRQGLHGKLFNCLKFRSMTVGADEIQERLRVVSQVDGPQFKMENDPRVNAIGRFLRNTYLDEIPQFINVLMGQMSIVGPRPSPELENSLSPHWRDARLSVRPGITGLWQICRTREESKDFQEWVHYDTEYVRNLSVRIDLWVCWKTAQKLINNFVDQF